LETDLDKARIEAILASAVERLDGDWLLLGGALVAVWVDAERRTEDIDLIGLRGPDDRRRLLDFAVSSGIPIEALNSAADFFLEKVPGWRDELSLWRTGPKGRIFWPSPTLFLSLKCRRLSEQDLEDCLKVLTKAKADGLAVHRSRITQTLDALPETSEPGTVERRKALRRALSKAAGVQKAGSRRRRAK
jgi:hypothetical protein